MRDVQSVVHHLLEHCALHTVEHGKYLPGQQHDTRMPDATGDPRGQKYPLYHAMSEYHPDSASSTRPHPQEGSPCHQSDRAQHQLQHAERVAAA